MVRFFVLVIPILFFTAFLSCLGTVRESDWTIEWRFLRKADSTAIFVNDSFSISHTLSRTIRYGRIDSIGRLIIGIVMPGLKEDVNEQNPTVKCMIYHKTSIVFDTSFTWDEMNFFRQDSQLYSGDTDYVSKKVIFVE